MDISRLNELEANVADTLSVFTAELNKVKSLIPSSNPDSDPVNSTLHKCLEVLESGFKLFRQSVNMELKRLSEGLSHMERRQDEAEQYSRRNCLLLLGVPETESTERENDTERAALDIFTSKLQVDISAGDIERSHRLGSRKQGKSRPIIVKFWSYKNRAKVFSAKSKLKDSGFRIAESLTKSRMAVLKSARDRFGVNRCWTSDGKILINLGDGSTSRRQVVTSQKDLDDLQDPTPSQTVPPSRTKDKVPPASRATKTPAATKPLSTRSKTGK